MENKLEQLLNSLIEKGWDVFPDKKFFGNKDKLRFSKGKKCVWFGNDDYTLRELVSKESGLWQFVCENGIVNVPHPNKGKYPRDKLEREQYKYWDRTIGYYGEDNLDRMGYSWDEYQYRLIETSLKDESELESFLLNNIKVE